MLQSKGTHSNLLSRLSLHQSSGNGGRAPSSVFPNCPQASASSFSSNSPQGLNRRSPVTNSLTHSPSNSLDYTNPQAGAHLTPIAHSFPLPSEDPLLTAAAPRYTASERPAQRTQLPSALLLLHECVAAIT